MTTTAKSSEDPSVPRSSRLQVLLAYENSDSGLRARIAFERIANRLELEEDFDLALWSLNLLSEPAFLNEAVADAVKADILFLSLHGRNELTAAARIWLERWVAAKGDAPCALAVSLDPGAAESPAGERTLELVRAAAVPAGVDVFLHQDDGFGIEAAPAFQPALLHVLSEIVRPEASLRRFGNYPYKEWGIND